jgi:hypothetical protein
MKKIHESLFIISKCHRHIQENWEAIEKYKQKGAVQSRQHFTFNLAYYILLEIDIFLDEYDKTFTTGDNERSVMVRVLVIKKILKPIYNRIKSFTHLHDFRNNIVAHPLRRKKQFILPQNKLYTVPRSWFEYQLLTDYIHYMFVIISQEFEVELGEAYYYAEQLKENTHPLHVDYAQVNADTARLLAEVQALTDKHQKNYTMKFITYQQSET